MAMAVSATCAGLNLSLKTSAVVSTTAGDGGRVNCSVPRLGSSVFGKGLQRQSSGLSSAPASALAVRGRQSGRLMSVRATLATEEAPPKADLAKLKADLLATVAGLDRGLVAEEADEFAANAAAQKLEAAAETVQLPEDLDKLDGKWRLVFSSGFNTGSYGGQRPGPSISRSPFLLGTVYQRIDVFTRELDNIVDLRFPAPWPLPPLEITATLAHSFELVGGSKIRLVFDKTSVKPLGTFGQLPQFDVPKLPEFLRPRNNSGAGTGEFETTYLDNDFRISRGDRGELRIFVKV
ncbi:hypothetical protein R1sor_025794 [Riccia sorocarpa]|uniref:Plastid lipid-associated protein/fibrillin conserved domain-containing protein n=1 Tax=Riccia sorocarpa TaxID=122646 RepID=A0ABD3GAZ6_9MARC